MGCAASAPSASRSRPPMPTRSTTGLRISSGAPASRCWRWRASACSASASPARRANRTSSSSAARRSSEAGGADAVLISCGGLLTLGCAEPIEQRHGIPVVTSTQSAFWKAMRLAGDSGHVDGRGRMLAQSRRRSRVRIAGDLRTAGGCGGAGIRRYLSLEMKARVTVTLKTGILDPQGKAIEGALKSLGVAGVASVRQGKVFDIEVEGADRTRAEAALKDAADKLLANTVIENYRIEVLGLTGACACDEIRRRRLPRHQSRARHGAHAPACVRRASPPWSGTPIPRCRPAPISWSSPAASPMATICAAARSRRARRSWTRCGPMPAAAGWCSASATASRFSASPGCCRAC